MKTGKTMPAERKQKDDPVTWLNQYGDALYRYARARVQDSFIAEDLVQDTLLAAYRSWKTFSGQSTVQTWLTGILKHKVVDYYRKLNPEQGDENLDSFAGSLDNLFDKKEKWKIKPGDWGGDPKNVYERKELMGVIHACLANMPEKLSLAYTLREMEGATTGEICELFQTGKNNCWVLLYRARMLLRRCLEVNWFGSRK
jgi:RNA polymerase sigma-70 factor (ECF subfamily)